MDGIKGSKKANERERQIQRYRAHPDDYARSVLRISVMQVCESIGFDSVKESALEALSNVAVRYICDLEKSAGFYANLAGRSECNVFDIVKGLYDMGSSSGAVLTAFEEGKQCVAATSVVKEIVEFVGCVEDVPFAQPIPRFPVVKRDRIIPSFSQMGESVSGKHIPEWLPAFPDPHTYMHSPIWNERKMEQRIDKGEQARQRRKAERSLLNLQQRLFYSGLASSGSQQHCRGVVDDGRAALLVDNAYLSPALPAGEKDVSEVALPHQFTNQGGGKKHLSVRETFAPVIDALKVGGLDPMDVDRRVVSDNRRPVVHFKLKAGKKMLVEDLDVHLRNKANGKKGSWFARDDDKDDKKRRAELILRQSIENAQEQSQM